MISKRNVASLTLAFFVAVNLFFTAGIDTFGAEDVKESTRKDGNKLEKTFTYISKNKEDSLADKEITYKGDKYILKNIKHEEKPIKLTEEVSVKAENEYPKKIQRKIKGEVFTLKAKGDVKLKEKAVELVTENREYKTRGEIPTTVEKDGKKLILKDVKETNKRENFIAPAVFTSYDPDSTEYIFNGQRVSISGDPVWNGYEGAIKDYLGVNGNSYSISSGRWTSDFSLVDPGNGRYQRTANYTGTRVVPYYIATFDSSETDPEKTFTGKVTYVADEKDITTTAIYEKEKSYTAIYITAGIALVALITAIILMILKRKKKKENEK